MLALLGENGAGKSTLMSILFGHALAVRAPQPVQQVGEVVCEPRAVTTQPAATAGRERLRGLDLRLRRYGKSCARAEPLSRVRRSVARSRVLSSNMTNRTRAPSVLLVHAARDEHAPHRFGDTRLCAAGDQAYAGSGRSSVVVRRISRR